MPYIIKYTILHLYKSKTGYQIPTPYYLECLTIPEFEVFQEAYPEVDVYILLWIRNICNEFSSFRYNL